MYACFCFLGALLTCDWHLGNGFFLFLFFRFQVFQPARQCSIVEFRRSPTKDFLNKKNMTSSAVKFFLYPTPTKMHTKSLSLSHAKSTRKFYCGCYSFLSVCAPCKRCKHRLSFFISLTNSTTFARSLIQISKSIVSLSLCALKVKYHVGVISSVFLSPRSVFTG